MNQNGDTNSWSVDQNAAADSDSEPSPEPRSPASCGAGEADVVAGGRDYLEVLAAIHKTFQPTSYLEIGVRHGHSLQLAKCEAIGVDPTPRVTRPLSEHTQIFAETSDHFFREQAATVLSQEVDLALIDGMHLFEFALRDFMNIEGRSHPASLIVFDDIFPNHPLQAARIRQTKVWTGDIWKIATCLRRYRPDLFLLTLSSAPTGLLLVAGLDRNNRVLRDHYNPVIAEYTRDDYGDVTEEVLDRRGAMNPDDPRLTSLLQALRELRGAAASREIVRERLRAWTVQSQV